MIAVWMLYVLVAGGLLAVAARAFEEVSRLVGLPTRWAWLAALSLVVVLTATAPVREAPPRGTGDLLPVAGEVVNGRAAAVGGRHGAVPNRGGGSSLGALVSAVTRAPGVVQDLLVLAHRVGRGPVGGALALGWGAASLLMMFSGAAMLVRSRRLRRCWPVGEVAGETVRIAPTVGPAVMGVIGSEIVIPRWLAAASPLERRLAVVHEREHQRGGDPYALALSYLALCLVPWHPAVWWMHRRLCLAVEVDCDRRVLRRGVGVQSYGSFLIDVAGREPGPSRLPAAAALIATSPMLERRIHAMTRPLPRLAVPRALVAGTLGAGVVFTACEARLPTGAELDAMDVAGVEEALERLHVRADDSVRYYVDGVQVTAEEARVLSPEAIARIDVAPRGDDRPLSIRLTTRSAGAEMDDGVAVGVTRELILTGGPPNRPGTVTLRAAAPDTVRPLAPGFDGLLFIDGVRVDARRLRSLDPDRIERVEILKGPAATRLYSEPEAARGVIRITTKR